MTIELPEPAFTSTQYDSVRGMELRSYSESQMRAYGEACAEAEREACAAMCEESVSRLTAGKRTHQVDRHVADVLCRHAKAMRAL